MRPFYKSILVLLLMTMSQKGKSQTWSTIDTLLQNNISLYNGNVVAMVSHFDSLVYYQALGTYDSLTQKPIASLTKTFSGAVILRLAQENIIDLDDSIGVYLPYATSLGKGSSTIRQNFSHTAGWNGTKGSTYLSNPTLNMQQCVDSIITYDPIIYTPGSKFKYSGVSMQVAARCAEIATGQDWNTLWTNKIKNPLGLNNTQFDVITNPRVAGGLVSTPSDIMKLARFILRNGKNDLGVQIVDSIWMQELWKDQTNKARVIASPYPYSPPFNNPYGADTIRYGIGTWLDIYNTSENFQEQISGAGAFGSVMWVNRCNNTCGVVFTYAIYGNVWPITFQIIDVVNTIYPNQCYQIIGVIELNNHFPGMNIYPNPTQSQLTIFNLPTDFSEVVSIYNSMGQLMFSEHKNGSHFSIQTGHLNKGIYFLQVKTDKEEMITRKFIKE